MIDCNEPYIIRILNSGCFCCVHVVKNGAPILHAHHETPEFEDDPFYGWLFSCCEDEHEADDILILLTKEVLARDESIAMLLDYNNVVASRAGKDSAWDIVFS